MISQNRLTRRVSALALLVAVVAVVVIAGVMPLLAYNNRLSTELADTRALLARFAGLSAARDVYEQQFDAFDAEEVEATVYLPGSSQGVAAASLQELVELVVEGEDAELKSTQALPVEVEGERQRTRIRVVLESDVATLARLFVELESHVPLVFVSNLDLKPWQDRSDGESGEPRLLARFDLYGYRKESAE